MMGVPGFLYHPGRSIGLAAMFFAAAKDKFLDPKDFALASPEELRVFFERHTLDAGDIVLLHDTCPHAAEVIPFLTAEAQRRGLKLMAMDG